jgi:hypothetical protein|nr:MULTISPECIES: hypothetical protein [Thermus]
MVSPKGYLGDLLREAGGIVPMVIRRRNSRRYVPWLQYLAIVGRLLSREGNT